MFVNAAKILRKACRVYAPDAPEVWPTVKRKQQHVMTEEGAQERKRAMENRCALDGHSGNMADLYTALSLSKMSKKAKEEYETYAGIPPPFPSAEECDRRKEESFERLKKAFRIDLRDPEQAPDEDAESDDERDTDGREKRARWIG